MPKRFIIILLIILLTSCASPLETPASIPSTESNPITESSEWWHTAIFYEIFVRSFYDTDSARRHRRFQRHHPKLGYLESLGITAIWLMPIHPSPSYHGYDVINYYAVNADYGTMDDFKNLLNEAHKRNIHIIIDLVINHTSSEHPWFKDANINPDSSYRDFYVWDNESGVGNWHQGQNGYYYGYFGAHARLKLHQPRCNYCHA
ncbi:MAG: hypothetical protein HC797_05930 [Anaerolineales bacterium]|nr:hypothetical protein [Anaerolineales bacterium]